MTTATATNIPFSGSPQTQTQQVFVMPETQTGFQKKVAEFAVAHGLPLSKRQIKNLGGKMHKRAAFMQTEFDFFENLRILGMLSDTTARDGEHRANCRNLECDKCGRTQWK